MSVHDFKYYLFAIDILKKSSDVFLWQLQDGKYSSVERMDEGESTGWFAVRKLADQTPKHLSEIYLFNRFNDRAVISFCQTKPEFIRKIVKSDTSWNRRMVDLSAFFWENYTEKGDKIPLDPLSLISIYSAYSTRDHKQLFYKESPILLYVEPLQKGKLSDEEMIAILDQLSKDLGYIASIKTIFSDCSTSNFFYNGHYKNNALVFLSNQNYNLEESKFKINRFFLNIIDYFTTVHSLNYFKKEFDNLNNTIDSFFNEDWSLKKNFTKNGIQKYHDYQFSILGIRNEFNSFKSQVQNLQPTITVAKSEIKEAVGIRSNQFFNLVLKNQHENLIQDVQKIDEYLSEIKNLINDTGDKIDLQEKFSSGYFQTMNALENIRLQKKVYIFSRVVFFLTVVVVLLSQWGQTTLLNLFVMWIIRVLHHF